MDWSTHGIKISNKRLLNLRDSEQRCYLTSFVLQAPLELWSTFSGYLGVSKTGGTLPKAPGKSIRDLPLPVPYCPLSWSLLFSMSLPSSLSSHRAPASLSLCPSEHSVWLWWAEIVLVSCCPLLHALSCHCIKRWIQNFPPHSVGLALFPSPGFPLTPIHTHGYLESGVALSRDLGLFQHNTNQPRPVLRIHLSGEFISPGFIPFSPQLSTWTWVKWTPTRFRTSQPSASGGSHVLTHNACFCTGGRCTSKQWALSCSQKDSLSQYRSRPWNKNPYFLKGFVEHLPLYTPA